MTRRLFIGLCVLSAVFVAGVAWLFHLRFEAGDIYPPYSSWRADPLGAKALFESLDDLVSVRRFTQPSASLGEGRDTTMLFLGASLPDLVMTSNECRQIEAFIKEGGRIVIALQPSYAKANVKPEPAKAKKETPAKETRANSKFKRAKDKKKAPEPEKKETEKEDENNRMPSVGVVHATNRWGFALNHASLARDAADVFQAATAQRQNEPSLPATLKVHSALYFDHLDKPWRTIYARSNGLAVVVERSLGHGSLVLLADAYPFSNEGLFRDRQPALLAWVVGSARQVVFDETHLGIQEEPGVAALARKYRLHGVAGVLAVLALLFIWRNATSLLPPQDTHTPRPFDGEVAGHDSASGFVNLLRRSVRPGQVFQTCYEQWRTVGGQKGRVPQARLDQAQLLAGSSLATDDPVQAYQRMAALLQKARPKSPPP